MRNEIRFIAANLLYHRAIGVERAYVFLDRCSDGTEEIAASLPWVQAIRLDPVESARFSRVPDLQAICMDRALELARQEGMDWLLALDADEFVADNNLRETLSALPKNVQILRILPEELLPSERPPTDPFWRQHHFVCDQSLRRQALDPTSGKLHQWRGNSGHKWGKSIVRTTADIQALGSHNWTRSQGTRFPEMAGYAWLETVQMPGLLHYAIVDSQHWYEKFRKLSGEPDTYAHGGPVEHPKQCWKQAAASMNVDEARKYFQEWVATSEERLQELVSSGVVREDRIVERTLLESGVLRGQQLVLPAGGAATAAVDYALDPSVWRDPSEVSRAEESDGCIRYQVADMPVSMGLQRVDFDGKQRYRWVGQAVTIPLTFEPADYLVTLRFHQASNWPVAFRASIDETHLPASCMTMGEREANVWASRGQLWQGTDHRLDLEFMHVGRSVSNTLGAAALTEIALDRASSAKGAA